MFPISPLEGYAPLKSHTKLSTLILSVQLKLYSKQGHSTSDTPLVVCGELINKIQEKDNLPIMKESKNKDFSYKFDVPTLFGHVICII